MASRIEQPESKPATVETQPDLCGQYRSIGIAAVAAAANARKSKANGPANR